MDVIQRLEPVIIEIERERECVVVVAHQAILRALYGYFMKIPLSVRPAANFSKLASYCFVFSIMASSLALYACTVEGHGRLLHSVLCWKDSNPWER